MKEYGQRTFQEGTQKCKEDSPILGYPTPLDFNEQNFYRQLFDAEDSSYKIWLGHKRFVDENGFWEWPEPIDWVKWLSNDPNDDQRNDGTFYRNILFLRKDGHWGLLDDSAYKDLKWIAICTFVDRRQNLIHPCGNSDQFYIIQVTKLC